MKKMRAHICMRKTISRLRDVRSFYNVNPSKTSKMKISSYIAGKDNQLHKSTVKKVIYVHAKLTAQLLDYGHLTLDSYGEIMRIIHLYSQSRN